MEQEIWLVLTLHISVDYHMDLITLSISDSINLLEYKFTVIVVKYTANVTGNCCTNTHNGLTHLSKSQTKCLC